MFRKFIALFAMAFLLPAVLPSFAQVKDKPAPNPAAPAAATTPKAPQAQAPASATTAKAPQAQAPAPGTAPKPQAQTPASNQPAAGAAQPQAQAASPAKAKPKPKKAPPKIAMATWTGDPEKPILLTKEDFAMLGLAKLTASEYMSLISWISGRQEAERKAARATQITYSCGPLRKADDDYERVFVSVDAPETTPPELINAIRQDLRGIGDVQIVATPAEADLRVSVLGFAETQPRSTTVEYTASLTVLEPCVSKLNGSEFQTPLYRNHILRTGTEDAELAARIVSDLNANEIEAKRKTVAALKKMRAEKR